MKGLLRNNYYSMQENMKLSLMIALFIGVLAAFVGNSLFTVAISVAIFIFPLNIGASLQTDETSKWNKFEITMPVSRKTVVLCKYLSYLMLTLIGTFCSFVTVLLFIILGHSIEMHTIVFSYFNGLSLAMFTGALMYPILLKFGALKSELIIVISVILSMGCTVVIGLVMGGLVWGAKVSQLSVSAVSMFVSVIFFVVSFFISVRIHAKKEF